MLDIEVCRACGCHKCTHWWCRAGHCKDCQVISDETEEAGALRTSAAGPASCAKGTRGGYGNGDHYWCN